ncbi:hypothetical protein DFJ73DRAFT_809092 [Zopfochytrium polystomum]|nr:hypothetical protein DFJ73DRAFT_809092 [Zopfochytrium polystomum]
MLARSFLRPTRACSLATPAAGPFGRAAALTACNPTSATSTSAFSTSCRSISANFFRIAGVIEAKAPSWACRSVLTSRSYGGHAEPPSKSEIEVRILQVLKDFDKVDQAKLTLDAHFYNDLGLDSLDQVEIAIAIEEEFNIELPDRDADEILTARIGAEKVYANKNAM